MCAPLTEILQTYYQLLSKDKKRFAAAALSTEWFETDSTLGEHYQRLIARFVPVLSNLESDDAAGDLEEIKAMLAPVQDSLVNVLPHLRFSGLGDATADGSFYFKREEIRVDGEETRRFRYESLSGGEKAVFDLLLDVHIAAIELGTPLICLDEPELHPQSCRTSLRSH